MKIYNKGQVLNNEDVRIEVFIDRNGRPVYTDSKIKVYTDKLGEEYEDMYPEMIICEIMWESGGFHGVNHESEYQFPLWVLNKEGIELFK